MVKQVLYRMLVVESPWQIHGYSSGVIQLYGIVPSLLLQNTYHTQFTTLPISNMTFSGIGYFQNTVVITILLSNALCLVELKL